MLTAVARLMGRINSQFRLPVVPLLLLGFLPHTLFSIVVATRQLVLTEQSLLNLIGMVNNASPLKR